MDFPSYRLDHRVVVTVGEAEVDGGAAVGAPVDLGELVLSAREADLESFDFAEPAFAFGFGDAGRVEETGDESMPFRLLDDQGVEIVAATEYLHHMLADDASPASLRSYAYELLSWHRFLRAVEVPWHRAGRVEARDFALWLKTSKKPACRRTGLWSSTRMTSGTVS